MISRRELLRRFFDDQSTFKALFSIVYPTHSCKMYVLASDEMSDATFWKHIPYLMLNPSL